MAGPSVPAEPDLYFSPSKLLPTGSLKLVNENNFVQPPIEVETDNAIDNSLFIEYLEKNTNLTFEKNTPTFSEDSPSTHPEVEQSSMNPCNSNEELRKDVKVGCMRFSAMFLETNIGMTNAGPMLKTMQTIAKDSKILKNMKMSETKCSAIAKECLAKRETEKLIKDLQITKFSIEVDESSDIGSKKNFAVLTKYVYPHTKLVKTKLLKLIELDARDCSAAKLFEAFDNCMTDFCIPYLNIIAPFCDNASVMIGDENSFYSRLKERVPHLILVKCICHLSALVASHACREFPTVCEELIRLISTYFSKSAKRCAILDDFQEELRAIKLNVLKLSTTRW